jgi:hypothetical protein
MTTHPNGEFDFISNRQDCSDRIVSGTISDGYGDVVVHTHGLITDGYGDRFQPSDAYVQTLRAEAELARIKLPASDLEAVKFAARAALESE